MNAFRIFNAIHVHCSKQPYELDECLNSKPKCLGSRDLVIPYIIKSHRIPSIPASLHLPTAFILLELRSTDMTEIVL